jgi:lipopolysaccharide export system protein LptA
VNRSRFFWFLVFGFMPGVIWAQTTATPKASPRASAHGQASPGGANKKAGATNKGGNADAKKSPDFLGGNDSSAKGPTEITAKDEVQFDGSNRMAIFAGNVKVIDPQFTMTTDKLTVYMNKQEDGGGIREAQADGNVIIVHANPQKNNGRADGAASSQTTPVANTRLTGLTPQASPSASPGASPQVVLDTGRAQKAIYNAKEDAVTLIGWPQVTQGINTHISTEEGTRMILYRDGRLQTFGPSRTVIQDKSSMNQPSPSPGEPIVDPKAQKNNVVH